MDYNYSFIAVPIRYKGHDAVIRKAERVLNEFKVVWELIETEVYTILKFCLDHIIKDFRPNVQKVIYGADTSYLSKDQPGYVIQVGLDVKMYVKNLAGTTRLKRWEDSIVKSLA